MKSKYLHILPFLIFVLIFAFVANGNEEECCTKSRIASTEFMYVKSLDNNCTTYILMDSTQVFENTMEVTDELNTPEPSFDTIKYNDEPDQKKNSGKPKGILQIFFSIIMMLFESS